MIHKVGDWPEARRILMSAPARIGRALHQATLQEAHYMRRMIVLGMRDQAPGGKAFTPLADMTLKLRRFRGFRGTKALIVRADLFRSVKVTSPAPMTAFVGVLRTARGKNGQSLANIAELNEFGSKPIVIQITPKMRRFLIAALGRDSAAPVAGSGGGSGTGVMVVKIPARPFIRPVAEKYFKPNDVASRFMARVGYLLVGDFGQIGVAIPR